MKLLITFLLIAFATLLHGQSDPRPGEQIDTITTHLDTITPNPTSQKLIQELTDKLAQIEQAKAQTTKELMLLVTGYLEDPRRLAGFTKDYKILVK